MTATASRENWRKEGWRTSGVRWLKFNAVGGIGIVVQLVVLAVLKVAFHFDHLGATALAVETAVIHNFFWHQRFTWFDRISLDRARTGDALARFLKFNLSTGAFSIIGNLSLMELLVGVVHLHYLVANMITISACSIVNFLVSDRWVFQEKAESPKRSDLWKKMLALLSAGVMRLKASLGWLGHFGWSLGGSQPEKYRSCEAASVPERTQSGTPMPR